MNRHAFTHSSGPFRADQIRPGDPYELSNGHAIWTLPQGGRSAGASAVGVAALGSDPAVESSGVEAGFSPAPDSLRAPDVAIGNVPQEPGWIQGAPPLAVEYADTGQDEAELRDKIAEFLAAGTELVWVVRLVGPRRVEVHAAGEPLRLVRPGEELTAPGILANPVPVEALYDAEAGRRVTLRNLLQREGYSSLQAVRDEGMVQSLQESIREILAVRNIPLDEPTTAVLAACTEPTTLRLWHRRALTADSAAAIFF